jgi:hypothetical protein
METISFYELDAENVIFQQDNAPCHTSKMTKDAFSEIELEVLDWPAQSPDLNPIEHFWGYVARELKSNTRILQSKEELWDEIQKILTNVNQELCRKLIGTMPRRIIDVIKAKGGYTKW